MTSVKRGGGLLLLAGALLANPGAGRAQTPDSILSGSAELGWRSFTNKPSAQQMAKFEEYRDMGTGPVLQNLRINYQPGDGRRKYELTAADAFRLDQALAGRAQQPGLFDLRLGWDRIPHTFSTDARLVAGSGTSSPFSLPSTLLRTLADTTAWRAAPFIGPVRTGWDVAQAVLTVTPDAHHDITADFTNIAKSGSRPMSMSLNATSLYREFLEPVDQNVRDLKLSESYVRRRYQVQLAYDLNAFDNSNASVSVTNPLLATSSPTAGSSVGRAALAPSNLAQTFTVAGGLNLPFRTRVNSTLSYGVRSQNEPFIPYTSNSALTDSRLATEPTSLNGDVRTLLANFTATTRPFRAVSLTARYRYWDFDDRTQLFTGKQIPLEVITDRSITAFADTTVVTERFPYRKQNAGLELRWSPIRLVGVQAGYAWERWNRAEGLEVATTNEYTPRLALDVTPADWISLRASVSHSNRLNDGYADGTANDNFNGFRRFNMADRDRNAGDLLAQISASDRLAFSANYSIGHDNYPTSAYGVQSDRNTVLGGDVSYLVGTRLTVFASYTYELYRMGELNKYRDGTNPNNGTFDYQIDERDLMQTGGVGLTGTLVPKRLDVEFRWDRSRGATLLQTRNPRAPSATTAASIANATATDFPEISHTWNPVHVSFRYDVNPNWSASLGFSHESWDSYDFRTAGLGTLVYSSASPAAVSGVPLGNDLLPYKADYLTFSIGFRPHLSRAARPIL